jgi:fumarate reductase subunit D
MQLLQQRDFSDFFKDTFQFIKENGRHFFLNYFIINGIFLIISLVKNYFTGTGMSFPFLIDALYIIFLIFFSIINWAFVTVYMVLYNERGTDFNYKDIINSFKINAGKIIIFVLVSILLAIPSLIALSIVQFILTITVVGIVLLPIPYALILIWYSMAFYENMINNKRPVFDCFGYSFTLMSKKFWSVIGSVSLLLVIIIIFYIFLFSAIGMLGVFTALNTAEQYESALRFQQAFMSPLFLIVLSVLSVLTVTLQINHGIIYFSQKELFENIQAKKSIDEIGKLGEDSDLKF